MTLENLPIIMLRALLVTIIIECLCAWIIGIRDKHNQKIIICANLVTNPLVVSLGAAIRYFVGNVLFYPLTIALEMVAVVVEAVVYKKYTTIKRNPYLVSILLNLASYIIGEIINKIIY